MSSLNSDENAGAPRGLGRAVWAGLFLVALWGAAVWHLRAEWSLNPQYFHGWLVPWLALYAFYMRAERFPPPGRVLSGWRVSLPLVLIAIGAAAAVLVREANPDWRLLGWVLSGLAMGATLLWLAGGGGWSWVRHFAFPVLFFLTAVPWPRPQENAVMGELMRRNAVVATESLRWLGFEATAKGNLIRLPTGTVGVEEACSGVRSLQGALMMTLFVGELFRLAWVSRAVLFLVGLGWVLLANAVRTAWLGWVAAREGPAAMERWHDVAGYTVLGLGFAVLLGVAMLLRRRAVAPVEPAAASPLAGPLTGALRRMRPAGTVGLALVLASVAGTQAWFAWREREVVRRSGWTVRFPQNSAGYREEPIAERIRGDLRYDEGVSAGWKDEQGRPWRALFFQWKPGMNGEQTVLVHDPRVCLQGSGLEIVETLPNVAVQRGGVRLEFEAYHFRNTSAEPVFVFNIVTSDVLRPMAHASPTNKPTWDAPARLQAVASGIRHLGQRRFEAAIWGAKSGAEAVAAFEGFLAANLVIEPRAVAR